VDDAVGGSQGVDHVPEVYAYAGGSLIFDSRCLKRERVSRDEAACRALALILA
jgi:hypothetical protein